MPLDSGWQQKKTSKTPEIHRKIKGFRKRKEKQQHTNLGVIQISNDGKNAEVAFFSDSRKAEMEIVKDRLTRSFEQIKDQFEDHLEAINENTNEIQSNFEYLCELDRKIDKLSERIDMLAMLIKKQNGEDVSEKKFEIKPLTSREKEVFFALYVLTEGKRFATYKDLARRTCYSENLVASYMTSLIEKGIPVVKKYSNRTAYLGLDIDFRQVQAKENIVGINTMLTRWMS